MKTLKFALLAAAGALAMGSAAHAEDAPALKLAFNVGAATDYVFRGISNTNEDPEVFGGVDATFAGIGYAGLWMSNVDFGDSTDAEYDLYAGVRPTLGGVAFDFGVIRYGYINEPKAADWTYYEFKAAASMPLGPATFGVAYYYSPDFTGPVKNDDASYFEGNAAVTVPNTKFSVSGAVGYQSIQGPGNNYTTWNAGVGYAINDHLALDVRYWDTDAHSLGKIYDSRVAASIKATF